MKSLADYHRDLYGDIDFGNLRTLVMGIGNGGNRAVDAMFSDVEEVDFIAVNTDNFALEKNYAETKIQIGEKSVNGLGTNGNMETGRKAAEESLEIIEKATEDYDMVLIVAGMGGGTSGGATPVIASAIKKKEILTIGVVTKPFLFEGTKRMQNAENGIKELKENVDTLIVIPNQKLIESEDKDVDSLEAFRRANKILKQCILSITTILVYPQLIGLDFADFRTVMSRKGGLASIGIEIKYGKYSENRCMIATEAACNSPFLEIPIEEAKCVIVNIFGNEDIGILERQIACDFLCSRLNPDAEVMLAAPYGNFLMKFGALSNDCVVTVIIAK